MRTQKPWTLSSIILILLSINCQPLPDFSTTFLYILNCVCIGLYCDNIDELPVYVLPFGYIIPFLYKSPVKLTSPVISKLLRKVAKLFTIKFELIITSPLISRSSLYLLLTINLFEALGSS